LSGASEEEIAAAEARLGLQFPDSYREFLAFTNGWRMLNAFVEQLWPAAELERYAVRHADLVDGWLTGSRMYPTPRPTDAEYLVYGPAQDPVVMRNEYLSRVVEVSDYADGVLLLNPEVVFEDGEWEAWFFAPWIPGARRFRSFWAMMNELKET
jgi:hypothetical protein